MSGIFRTFGNTWNITKTSMSVLGQDKELLVFPVLAGVFVLIIAGITAGIFASIGTFDRLDTAGEGSQLKAGDIVVAGPLRRIGIGRSPRRCLTAVMRRA